MVSPEIQQLAARVGEPIEDESDISLAQGMLDDAWNWVRHYGDSLWASDSPDTPAIARTVALAAAARGYQNPAGYADEKSDSLSLSRDSDFSKLTHPTPLEIRALEKAANHATPALSAMPTTSNRRFVSRWDAFRDPPENTVPLIIGNPNHGVMWVGEY